MRVLVAATTMEDALSEPGDPSSPLTLVTPQCSLCNVPMMPRAPWMISWALAAACLLGGLAPPALASGVNLNWNDCIAGGISTNKAFACNGDTGAHVMFGSYVPLAYIDSVCGAEIVLDLQSMGSPLPLWWNFQSGGCRAGSLTRGFDFTGGPFNCLDHWNGNVAFSALSYAPGFSGPNTARIVMFVALSSPTCTGPYDTGVEPGSEYYAFKLTLNHAKTVGDGSCAGCLDPVCVVLNEIKLEEGHSPVSHSLVNPDTQNHVTWQGGAISPPGCPGSTPVLNRTWGAVKSLYR
jgi:hypothetical protein